RFLSSLVVWSVTVAELIIGVPAGGGAGGIGVTAGVRTMAGSGVAYTVTGAGGGVTTSGRAGAGGSMSTTTRAFLACPWLSRTRYSNSSDPTAPLLGVYVIVLSELITADPCVGLCVIR